MGVAFEEKVLRAEEDIERALAAKEGLLAPAARRIVLKGFRPAQGGKILESKIPGYKPLDKGNARAYEEAARRLLEKGVLEEVVMTPGNRGLIAHVAASRAQAREIPPKAERMESAVPPDKAGEADDSPLSRLGGDPSVPQWAMNWARDEMGGEIVPRPWQGDVVRAIEVLGKRTRWFERGFSVECYGDSKYFARHVRDELAKVVKRYSGRGSEGRMKGLSDVEVMSLIGIDRPPREVFVGGPLSVRHGGSVLDLAACGPYGAGVFDAMVAAGDVQCAAAKALLLVENKTNYHAVLEMFWKDVVVVFLSGAMSPSTKRVVDKIDRAMPSRVPRLVWADIDAGGFSIARGVMRLFPSFKPFLMGFEEMERFENRLRRNPPAAKRQLAAVEGMLEDLEGTPMKTAALAVLSSKRTLEQEMLLGGYAEERIENAIRVYGPSA